MAAQVLYVGGIKQIDSNNESQFEYVYESLDLTSKKQVKKNYVVHFVSTRDDESEIKATLARIIKNKIDKYENLLDDTSVAYGDVAKDYIKKISDYAKMLDLIAD